MHHNKFDKAHVKIEELRKKLDHIQSQGSYITDATAHQEEKDILGELN